MDANANPTALPAQACYVDNGYLDPYNGWPQCPYWNPHGWSPYHVWPLTSGTVSTGPQRPIKSIEYHENGTIKRIEYFDKDI